MEEGGKESHGPSDMFLTSVAKMVDRDDVGQMVGSQQHMLMRFEKTNEMLLNFNSLSVSRYNATCAEFSRHTDLLLQMKKDLDTVFTRIRGIKTKLAKEYPSAFAACNTTAIEEEEEEVEESKTKTQTLHETK